jgi:hypothetical protein
MDTSKYGKKGGFIKYDTVEGKPFKGTIEDVTEDTKFDRLNLVFTTGESLSLNVTNTAVMQDNYGMDSDGWIGQRVELSASMVLYKNDHVRSVVLKPLSLPTTKAPDNELDDPPRTPPMKATVPERLKPKPTAEAKPRTDMDDETPF